MLQQYELDRRIYNAPQNEAPISAQGETQPVAAQ